ncbi:kelch-like protein 17 [Bactrocera dorsalis]|uniref:Kelch-like protein diablo n=1 Tax=Bactrocera dorsalis TaxID=27457 RepID=A0ABM3JP54_BACDO|nr:kelch-like protein 17 [Bactrocera dorsalis]
MATSCTQRPALQTNSSEQNRFMEKLVAKIFSFYDEHSLIDVTFKVSNPTALIPAHRLILAAASPYFENLFHGDQGNNPVLEINDIDSETFERLISFCYTGQTLITVNNVGVMLKAANVLQLDEVITNCVDYIMAHIDEYTLWGAHTLERETQCQLLQQKIIEYAQRNFMEIRRRDEFLNFDVEKMQRILESDNLNITREEVAFDAIKRWFNYDVPARQEQLPLLIACLRLTQFDADFLLAHIQSLPGCEMLALKAITWISKPEARTKINLRFTEPRRVEAVSLIREPEAQPKINMQIKGPSEVEAFSLIREPEAQPKINMRFTEPREVCAANCGEKTLLAVCSWKNPKLLKYNKAADKWQEYASRATGYRGYRTILKDNNILFIGGKKGYNALNIVKSWNIRNKTWQSLPSMNQARWHPCVVEVDDNIYAIGGFDGKYALSSVERYTTSDGWKFMRNLIVGRQDASAVGLNGKIYIIGGRSDRQALKSVECYNPGSNTWTSCADITEYHHLPAVAAHKGHIYVVGDCHCSRVVERYDPQRNTWSMICSLNTGGGFMASVSLDNKLWAIGGTTAGKTLVSVYDEENDRWGQKFSIPETDIFSCFVVPVALLTSK